jgi:hypothetical protein
MRKPYPPMTIAIRLATLATVPVKSIWREVKPVSNGDGTQRVNLKPQIEI